MGTSSIPPKVLEDLLEALRAGGTTMSEMERAMEKLKSLIGQAGLEKLIERLGAEDDLPKACPRCGRKVRVRARSVKREVETLSGTQTIQRHYHYCDACQEGFYPRDAELGLPFEGRTSFELEDRLCDFAVNDAYEVCSRRWRKHYGRSFSPSLFRSVANRVGRRLAACDQEIAQRTLQSARQKASRRLYVMNDGGMIPMVHGRWREVKLGVVFRDEDHVEGGRRRGFIDKARYVGVLGEQPEFKEAMRAALNAENWRRAKEVVWLGDGALGNWTLAETLAPTAIQILDIQHAIEHGMDCGKALLGESSPLLEAWRRRIEQLVYAGDVDVMLRELMECWLETNNPFATKAIGALVGYYRHNESRMRYAEYLDKNLMIGSGVIESAHRHVIQSRMKKAGQHWSEKGGALMVGLRAAYSTNDDAYSAIHRALCVTYLRRAKNKAKAA